ncbi:MAG: hypothetical protein M3P12_07840 [Gemmatimonadota bacterium]|nr:hypothetical protein [Gemmatimonadota bacterium]
MTCEECLLALETESLREMTPDSPVLQHCARCPDCARVTTMVRDQEYEAATILNGLPPMSNPLTVAETAVRTGQRRRVGRVVVLLSAVAGALIIWLVSATMLVPALSRAGVIGGGPPPGGLRTETMQLTCLSPEQAADIINPYVRKHGSTFWIPSSGISAITVRGTPDELAKSRNLILEFEKDPGAACRAPATTVGKLEKALSDLQGPTNNGPDVMPGRAPTNLLGAPAGTSLLSPKAPTATDADRVPTKVLKTPAKQ